MAATSLRAKDLTAERGNEKAWLSVFSAQDTLSLPAGTLRYVQDSPGLIRRSFYYGRRDTKEGRGRLLLGCF